MKDILALLVACFFTFIMGASVGYRSGREEEKVKTPEPPKSDCLCGARQTCPFGVGIVGEQVCRTDLDMRNVWSRCEPAGEKP